MTVAVIEKENHITQARAQLASIVELVANYKAALKEGQSRVIDEAEQRIHEDALSVEVRSDWHTPGGDTELTEYRICLCTGGPAVQITGELNGFGEPETAALQARDWFKPWENVPVSDEDREAMLTYARCFYYGE